MKAGPGRGWRPGDPPGQRRFQTLFRGEPLRLESGRTLGPITLAYECWGRLTPAADNAVLLLHGFSGDSHAAGPAGPGHPQPGWWDALIGPGRAIDTDRFHVVCPNVLGGCQGSTGPWSSAPDGRPWGARFPELTIRDQVAAEQALADALGIERWHAVIGGSMGGMRALEWAVDSPQRLERLVSLATVSHCSADNLAIHACQRQAILLDPDFREGDHGDDPEGGPRQGLILARSLARLTYGSERELEQRTRHLQWSSDAQAAAAGVASATRSRLCPPLAPCPPITPWAAERLLRNDAEALAHRFDAHTYLTLLRAMDHHDVARGRGGLKAALSRIRSEVTIVSVSSDRLFPPERQEQLAAAISNGVRLRQLQSDLGHDGFLEEHVQLESILQQALGTRSPTD